LALEAKCVQDEQRAQQAAAPGTASAWEDRDEYGATDAIAASLSEIVRAWAALALPRHGDAAKAAEMRALWAPVARVLMRAKERALTLDTMMERIGERHRATVAARLENEQPNSPAHGRSNALDALNAADPDDPTVDAPEPEPSSSSSASTAVLASGLDEKGYAALRVQTTSQRRLRREADQLALAYFHAVADIVTECVLWRRGHVRTNDNKLHSHAPTASQPETRGQMIALCTPRSPSLMLLLCLFLMRCPCAVVRWATRLAASKATPKLSASCCNRAWPCRPCPRRRQDYLPRACRPRCPRRG